MPTPPDECTTTCNTACSGSCTAQANVQCQLDCQAQAYAAREQQIVERCNTDCETTGGAIFCDGQFLNVANIDDCAAELAADVDINVNLDAQAAGHVNVSTNPPRTSTSSSHHGAFSCALASAELPRKGSTGAADAGLALLALAALLTERRRQHQDR